MLAILPCGRIVVLDCVVTHPATASYARGASRQAGFAAAKAETNKRRAFGLFSDCVGYEFLPLAGESFGRLGKDAARFLIDFSDVAASDGYSSKCGTTKRCGSSRAMLTGKMQTTRQGKSRTDADSSKSAFVRTVCMIGPCLR